MPVCNSTTERGGEHGRNVFFNSSRKHKPLFLKSCGLSLPLLFLDTSGRHSDHSTTVSVAKTCHLLAGMKKKQQQQQTVWLSWWIVEPEDPERVWFTKPFECSCGTQSYVHAFWIGGKRLVGAFKGTSWFFVHLLFRAKSIQISRATRVRHVKEKKP